MDLNQDEKAPVDLNQYAQAPGDWNLDEQALVDWLDVPGIPQGEESDR